MSPRKFISFPSTLKKSLKDRILNYLPIWTTRVSDLYDKYSKGDILDNDLLKLPLYVSSVEDIESLNQHRFQLFLTPLQKDLLSKYKKMRLLKLVPYKWGNNPVYFQTAGDGVGNRIRIAKLIKKIKLKKLQPQTVKIDLLPVISLKLDKVWGNADYKKARPLSLHLFASNHFPRIMKADLRYPILMSHDKKYVYDGMHRLIKAMYNKRKTLPAYVIPKNIVNEVLL